VTAEHDRYVDLAGLAAYSSLGRTTLRDLIRAGEFPAYQPSGKLLVKLSEFDAWVTTHKVGPADRVKQVVNDVIKGLGKDSLSGGHRS
jgi:excisionase family DNA binding protein